MILFLIDFYVLGAVITFFLTVILFFGMLLFEENKQVDWEDCFNIFVLACLLSFFSWLIVAIIVYAFIASIIKTIQHYKLKK